MSLTTIDDTAYQAILKSKDLRILELEAQSRKLAVDLEEAQRERDYWAMRAVRAAWQDDPIGKTQRMYDLPTQTQTVADGRYASIMDRLERIDRHLGLQEDDGK